MFDSWYQVFWKLEEAMKSYGRTISSSLFIKSSFWVSFSQLQRHINFSLPSWMSNSLYQVCFMPQDGSWSHSECLLCSFPTKLGNWPFISLFYPVKLYEVGYHMIFQAIWRHTILCVSLEWLVKHQMTMLTSVWELTNMYKQLTFKSRPKAVHALDLKPPPCSLPLIEGSCCLCLFSSAEGWDIDGMCPQYLFRFVLFYNSFSLWDHVGHWDV